MRRRLGAGRRATAGAGGRPPGAEATARVEAQAARGAREGAAGAPSRPAPPTTSCLQLVRISAGFGVAHSNVVKVK